MVTRILLAAYFLEAGLILIVAPWSGFWDRNLFFDSMPEIQPLLASPASRGAVSGIGVITVLAGLVELASLLDRRRSNEAAAPTVKL